MKKVNNLLLPFLLITALFFTSCRRTVPGGSQTDEPGPGETINSNILDPNDKVNWTAAEGVKTNYVKLDDINPESVPEIKISFAVDSLGYKVVKTADGFICGYIPGPALSAAAEKSKTAPRIRKLDRQGKVVWEKEYDYEVYSGRVNNIISCIDGSFIFSVQTFPFSEGNEMIYEKSCIIKCDSNGNKLWEREFDDYSGDLLHDLFVTQKNEIITIGRWGAIDGKQTKNGGADDIVITRLDKDGNVLQQKSFGGSDFDMLNTARYDKELGIIINGRTQSKNGDFAISKDITGADFIAAIDENLDFKWVFHADNKESFIYDQLAVWDDCIYIPGGSINTGTPASGFLIKIDRDGKMVWKNSGLYTSMWAYAISVLQNGDIVLGSGQMNQGMILVFDKDGSEKKRMEDLKFAPRTITPTQDGGFIVTATREIKAVPQPPFISSIWYDTEVVAAKYNADLTVEWRKTYDKVKGDRGGDFAFPLEDGRIMVE